jgi:hypothetical protein
MVDEPAERVAGGPWQDRVKFAPGGGLAYRPGEILVRGEVGELAAGILAERFDAEFPVEELQGGNWVRFGGLGDPLQAIEVLRRFGVASQVNHVLFANVCCPPHPATPEGERFYASPFYASALHSNPVYANPFYASPFYASPFYASAGSGCGCCGCCGSAAASPFYASPFYASPFYASPFYASAVPSPAAAPAVQATGMRRSSARPAGAPQRPPQQADHDVRIAILDTGYAEGPHRPAVPPQHLVDGGGDIPDEDGDAYLDPAAGHGTFIAGLIERTTPGCQLEAIAVLSGYGDSDEARIGEVLFRLAERPQPPHFVNLSFSGYSPLNMDYLADAVNRLHDVGTVVVASAGNDATCIPTYPAVLPGVIGVGALDEDGNAAPFTNYGPWVRACTLGVDVLSTFFDNFNGAEPPVDGADPDDFRGWARWSGTSFAGPIVVAALAQAVINGRTPRQAETELVSAERLPRRAMLGTIVRP